MVHSLIADLLKHVEGSIARCECFMQASVSGTADDAALRALSDEVQGAASDADHALRQLVDALGSSPFLPGTRSELVHLATASTRVADRCARVARMTVLRRFRFPNDCGKAVLEILRLTRAQFHLLQTTISKLFSDFAALMKDHAVLDEIRGYESRVDDAGKKLFEEIYAQGEQPLSERMLIAEFVEWICGVSGEIEDIADQVQIMIITREA